MPAKITEKSSELTDSVDIVSKFLALEQIYSAKDLNAYLETLQQKNNDASADVIVLCASAILAIPEAVFGWAAQKQTCPEAQTGNTILVLCGGIGPCTSFVYDAIRASKKYCQIFDEINGKPEGQILKIMAERVYRLDINDKDTSKATNNGFDILVSERSTDCGADALETRRVLESYGIGTPRSITVVQDPAMSSRTVSCFEDIYRDHGMRIASWPQTKPDLKRDQGESENGKNSKIKELWSMDRFLDRIMGDTANTPSDLGKVWKNTVDIPNEVEDAWSTIMEKNSLKVSC